MSVHEFAEQHRAAIAELRHELAELMAGICLRKRLCGFRQVVAREHRDAIGPFEPLGIDAELFREPPVDADPLGLRDGRRTAALEEPFRQFGESVIEMNGQGTLLAAQPARERCGYPRPNRSPDRFHYRQSAGTNRRAAARRAADAAPLSLPPSDAPARGAFAAGFSSASLRLSDARGSHARGRPLGPIRRAYDTERLS